MSSVAAPAPAAPAEAPETADLLARARAGDPGAFGELCRQYETRLLRQAWSLCGDAVLAEELAQDTLVAAWQSLPGYRGGCRFFTWLCAILLHRHRNHRRVRRPVPFSALAGPEAAAAADHADLAPDPAASPDAAVAAREQSAAILACLQNLPPKQREVIHLRFYVDDSLEGIAAALDCSIGTVKSRLFTALENLRAMRTVQTQFTDHHSAGPSAP